MKYLLLLLLVSCNNPSYKYEYKIGDCAWHIHQSKNPDGSYKRNIFKIIGTIKLEGEPYYITDVINWHYQFNHFSPKLASATYYDKGHSKHTHNKKCKTAVRKDIIEDCIKNKNWEFTTGQMKCPTREEYCKDKDCWEKK
jgi:hypothetical protein